MNARHWLMVLMLNSVLVVAGILVYDQLRPPMPPLGVVDLASVYREKEAAFAKVVGSDQASEDERNRAMAAAQAFAKALPAALEGLSDECGCVVLMGNAVASKPAQILDLTPRLRAKVGM